MKIRSIGLIIVLSLIGLQMTLVGVCKILGVGPFIAEMAQLHYPASFARFIGVCEVLGVLGLVQHRFRLAALLCFLILIVGAIGSHFGAGQGIAQATPAIISLGLIMLALWLSSGERLKILFTSMPVQATSPS